MYRGDEQLTGTCAVADRPVPTTEQSKMHERHVLLADLHTRHAVTRVGVGSLHAVRLIAISFALNFQRRLWPRGSIVRNELNPRGLLIH